MAQGRPFVQAARRAGFASRTAVAGLVARFNRHGLGLAAGRGRKATYDSRARAQIVATTQRPPDRKVAVPSTWSLSTLQRTLRRDGLPDGLPRLGATTIRRVLEDAGSAYQKTRTWCPTCTALRGRRAGVVAVVDPQTEEKRG